MVYAFVTGRIGNNLFQIATGAALAHRNKSEFVACITDTWCTEPDNCYLEKYLEQFRENIFRNITFIKGKPTDATVFDQVLYVEQIPYYDNICLHGLWQSENYFVKERDHILKLLAIDEKTELFLRKTYSSVFSEDTISIVVRRGDYIKQPQFHPTCSKKYYRAAIKYFGTDKKYLIISDDIAWCKTKFKGDNFLFSNHESPVVDLYLQTFCKHNIISNSSFAWWGAWLNPNNDKVVIAPRENWCGYFYKDFYRKDLLPSDWVLLPNPLSMKHKIVVFGAILLDFLIRIKHYAEKTFKK
jgi:hypothetical protein